MFFPEEFDVIVVGGGHAGTEAALAAARSGAKTLLLTHNIDTIGHMSCNPSIGGIGKSHLVKEIDALGGAMAIAADKSGIQFRTLNESKGKAVRATRAQIDRLLYKQAIRSQLENQSLLWLFQQGVEDLIIKSGHISGLSTQAGIVFKCQSVVLTTGTFLDSKIHIGLNKHAAGRAGDCVAITLSSRLKELGFPKGRLKTGTPPRIDGRSIDFSRLEIQKGSESSLAFSFMGDTKTNLKQIPCWVTHTNIFTHDIIRANLDRSPIYSGIIEGVGPRYCPSVEDKVSRFPLKESHQIYLEPEGLTTNEFYPNGISTSLPFDVQISLVRSIVGLEKAHILRPGYAIEYDYFNPCALKSSLETKSIKGLFFAGQINGTTGYEEAGIQGLLAGINASRQARGLPAWFPRRDQAYLGVLIDDLITRGVDEPYRMFTSRAEYRLSLREDNADNRLTEIGRELGLVDDARWQRFLRKRDAISHEITRLSKTFVHPNTPLSKEGFALIGKKVDREYSLYELLRRPNINYSNLAFFNFKEISLTGDCLLDQQVKEQVEIMIKYQGYISRQAQEMERDKIHEKMRLPGDINYEEIRGLSHEIKQKLSLYRPDTIARAMRISGITPAAISLLMIYLKKRKRMNALL